MPESNFVDYVKILCRSGKGGRGSMHLRHVKYNPNGGTMAVTEDVVATSICVETTTTGHCFTFATSVIFSPETEATEAGTSVMAQTVTTFTSTYRVER